MVWFTADWHLSHKNIIKYCNRPFSSVEEMDNTIIDNFRSKVHRGDTVYFLGDLTFNRRVAHNFFEEITDGIQVHFIFGNHDKSIKSIVKENSAWYGDLKRIQHKGQDTILSHYAMRVWEKSHFNSWNLFGHSHGGLEGVGKQIDIGVDTHSFFPYSFDEIKEIMDNREDNFNFIPENER